MAIKGLRGYGVATLNNNSPLTAQDLAYFPRLNEFTLGLESTFYDAMAFTCQSALQEIVDTIEKSRTWTLSIGFQSFDKNDFELLFNEFAQTTASLVLPTRFCDIVPASAPYEIVNTDLAGATVSTVHTTLLSDGSGDEKAFQMVATPGPASATDVELDEPNTKLVFDSSYAGRGVSYVVYKTITSKDTIYVENSPINMDQLSFFGIIDGPRLPGGMAIYVPKMGRNSGFELNIAEETNASIEFRPGIANGNRSPVQFAFL